MPPVKNRYCDFLRRHYPHQVEGSKFDYFLSACLYKLPCFYYNDIIYLCGVSYKHFMKKCMKPPTDSNIISYTSCI